MKNLGRKCCGWCGRRGGERKKRENEEKIRESGRENERENGRKNGRENVRKNGRKWSESEMIFSKDKISLSYFIIFFCLLIYY